MANVKKVLGKTLSILLVVAMLFGIMSTAMAAGPNPWWPGHGHGGFGGGYVLDEKYFDGDRAFGWDTYSENATLLDENGNDVYGMITVSVGDEVLGQGGVSRSVNNQDVVDHGVTISNIPAGYYISAYKIVCEKYACFTDQAGNATDEQVSLDAGQGSYHVAISERDMGHSNTGATAYYILIELSAFRIEDEEIVTYPYNVFYNYGELSEALADMPATVDSQTYVYNSSATLLSPIGDTLEAAAALGYRFVSWEVESVEGVLAITSVVGTELAPASPMTVTGETTLKALWEKIPVPSVTVEKLADGDTFEVGEIVTWTITVTNTSEFTAYDVVVTDILPAGLELVEGELVTTIKELAPGASQTITVKTRVLEAGQHSNSASAAWTNGDGDPFGGDPTSDTVEGEIPETPAVDVEKTADGKVFEVGEIITWTITVTNTSEFTAYDVTVTDVLPAGLELVEGERVTTIKELAPGASQTITVKTRATKAGEYMNKAEAVWVNVGGDPFTGDPGSGLVVVEDPAEYTLVVNYVDTEGNKLADPVIETGIVEGSEYTTEEKIFEGYTFVETTGDAPAGMMDGDKKVTYVYELNTYTLTIRYVDTEGNELADTVVTEGLTHGSEYTTEEKAFEGYTFVETTGDAAEGTMDGDKEVVYVYELNTYTLTVRHVDTEGSELADAVILTGLAHGSKYATEARAFEGYTFVETTGDAAEGTMDGDKEVVYVYELNTYTLTVRHVDTEGNELAPAVVRRGLAHGSEYATKAAAFEGYTFVETTGDAAEGIMDGDKEVTYVYELNTYTLTVRHVDTEGNELADAVVFTGLTHGSKYATEARAFEGYTFVETTGDAAEGTMDGDKTVTYIYGLNTYTLTVRHVDTEGNELADTVITEGLTHGSEYTTARKAFVGYTFMETTGDAAEGIMDGNKAVTYVYELNEYTLTVHYVDTEGNRLADAIVVEGLTHGSEYTTEEKAFEGYTFVETVGDAVEGIMDGDKAVTYIYELNEYTLTVRYVDTEGNELAAAVIIGGIGYGSEYAAEEKAFEGYTFVETTGDAAEGIMDGDKEVTFIYELNTYTLVVRHEDEQGNALAPTVIRRDLPHGSRYIAAGKHIIGYVQKEVRGDAAEGIMDGNKEVIYIYAPRITPQPPAEDPVEDIPDEDVPLTDIPDEEVPKTGDITPLLAVAALLSGVGAAGLVIRRKKDEE